MKNITYILLFIIIFTTGCIEIIDINPEYSQPKIVLNGIIDADSIITVYVSKSYPFARIDTSNAKGNLSSDEMKNIDVEIYINGISKGKMNYTGSKPHSVYIFTSNYRPKVGDLIKIEASAPGFKNVWTETQIPKPIIIQNIDTATFYMKKENDSRYYNSLGGTAQVPYGAQSLNLKLKININDSEPNLTNHYGLSIFQRIKNNETFINAPTINVTSEPLLNENNAKNAIYAFFSEENNNYLSIFTDDSFTNNKYTLNLSLWGYYFYTVETYYDDGSKDIEMHNSPIEISIISYSKELYDYYKLHQNSSYEELPYIFESKSTYSNVHNGIGVLCSRSITTKLMELPLFTGKIFSDDK